MPYLKIKLKNLQKRVAFFLNICYYDLAVSEKRFSKRYAAVAQLDRVFGYEPKGRGFESLQPYQKADHQ